MRHFDRRLANWRRDCIGIDGRYQGSRSIMLTNELRDRAGQHDQ
jgi:hypothetical protein